MPVVGVVGRSSLARGAAVAAFVAGLLALGPMTKSDLRNPSIPDRQDATPLGVGTMEQHGTPIQENTPIVLLEESTES